MNSGFDQQRCGESCTNNCSGTNVGYIYIYTHIYILMYIYIYVYIYIHTHTQQYEMCLSNMGCGPSHFHSLWIRWFPRLKVQKDIIQSSTGGFFGVPEPFGTYHGDQNLGLILEKKGKSVLYWSWLNTPGLPKINGFQSKNKWISIQL